MLFSVMIKPTPAYGFRCPSDFPRFYSFTAKWSFPRRLGMETRAFAHSDNHLSSPPFSTLANGDGFMYECWTWARLRRPCLQPIGSTARSSPRFRPVHRILLYPQPANEACLSLTQFTVQYLVMSALFITLSSEKTKLWSHTAAL